MLIFGYSIFVEVSSGQISIVRKMFFNVEIPMNGNLSNRKDTQNFLLTIDVLKLRERFF